MLAARPNTGTLAVMDVPEHISHALTDEEVAELDRLWNSPTPLPPETLARAVALRSREVLYGRVTPNARPLLGPSPVQVARDAFRSQSASAAEFGAAVARIRQR